MLDQYASSDAQGLQAYSQITAEHEDRVNVTLDAATEGTLTTRTDNDTGVITVESHPFSVSDVVDVFWDGGSRLGMDVTAQTATTVSIDGGTGDNLPVTTTEIWASEPIEVTQAVVRSKQQSMIITTNGRMVVRTNGVTGTFPADETWEFEANDGFAWRESGVFANPFSADVTAFWLSNGRTQATTFQFRNLRTE
jgi:hypothetical protein